MVMRLTWSWVEVTEVMGVTAGAMGEVSSLSNWSAFKEYVDCLV